MWQIAVKPGKPLAFGEVRRKGGEGQRKARAFFLGLPGNPVSSFVTFLLFVRPFLLRLQGVSGDAGPAAIAMRADFDWPKADRRNEFLRARINAGGRLDLFPNQGSGVLTSTVWGDGLIDNPPGQAIARGDIVRFIPFANLAALSFTDSHEDQSAIFCQRARGGRHFRRRSDAARGRGDGGCGARFPDRPRRRLGRGPGPRAGAAHGLQPCDVRSRRRRWQRVGRWLSFRR
jgi:hypothetical protein